MAAGGYYFWLGASADADRAAHEPSLKSGPSGEHPLRRTREGCGCLSDDDCALNYGGGCRWTGGYE